MTCHSSRIFWQLLLLVALGLGCNGREPLLPNGGIAMGELRGRVFSAEGSLLLPGRGWEYRRNGRWQIEADAAELHFQLAEASPVDVVLRFRVADELGLEATWDATDLHVVGLGDGFREVTVAAPELDAGAHVLRLRPIDENGAHVKATIRWLGEAGGGLLPPAWLNGETARPLAAFLDLGMIGPTEAQLHDGFATVGPGVLRVKLDHARGGTLVLPVSSSSGGRVRAALPARREGDLRTLQEAELEPGEPAWLRVPVPAREPQIELTIQNVDDSEIAAWGGPWLLEEVPRVPTLVLITLDTVRRDALTVYGATPEATPRLDRFAAAATVYERASSTTSWTLPAHASMFTGLYPAEHRAGVASDRLDRSFATLAERLLPRYVTAGFVGGALLRHVYGTGQGFGSYRVPAQWETPGRELVAHSSDTIERLDGVPLFLFVNLFDAHYRYLPPDDSPYREALAAAIERIPAGSRWRALLEGDVAVWSAVINRQVAPDSEGLAALQLAYEAEVHEVDRQVGELLDALERAGRLDDALVVIAADHGELLGEGGFFSHAARLDPELVDIPLIVKYPRQREAARVSTPVSLIDLFPTFLRAAGLEVPASSAISLPLAGTSSARAGVLFEENEHWVHPLPASMRLGKTIHGFDGGPGRRVRWPAGEQCQEGTPPDRVAVACSESLRTLHESLRQQLEQTDRGAGPEPPRELEAAERVRLEALGYL